MDIFLYFIYGVTLFYFSYFFPYSGLAVSFSALLLIIFFKYKSASLKLSQIAFIIIFSASGFFYAKLSYIPPAASMQLYGNTIEVKGVLKSEKPFSSFRGKAFLQTIFVIEARDEKGEKLSIKELRGVNERQLVREKTYLFYGRFSKDGYFMNPGSYNYLPIFHILSSEAVGGYEPGFFEKARIKLNNFIRHSLSDASSAFILSIITGERAFLTGEMKNAFNATGLAHILSISGAHFGLLFVILFGFFRILFKYLPYKLLAKLTIYTTPSQIAVLMTAPFLMFYLGISSLSIPSVRAFIMITFFLAGLLLGRKGFWLNTLLIAAFIIVLIEPGAITDISFQLSFTAVLCIGIVSERLTKEEKNDALEARKEINSISRAVSSIFRYLKNSLFISLAATAGTAPLVAYHFHYFSLVSPLANLFITPLIGFLILPVALFSSLVYLVFDFFPFTAMLDKFTLLVLGLIEKIALFDYADIKLQAFPLILIFSFYTGFLIFLAANHQKNNKRNIGNVLLYIIPLSIAILPFFIYITLKVLEPKTLNITFLDVGQGDSSVVELPDGRIIVIDTGKSGYQTGEFLRYRGIKNIDALAISHMQSDHAGGLEYLLSNFRISEIWGSGFEGSLRMPEQITRFRRLQRGDEIEGNGYKISIFHPYDNFYNTNYKEDENNYSLVMKISGAKTSFLLTGDIEIEAQEDLVHLKEHLKSSVLKVPHHGSKSSAYEMFYNSVSPDIAVISSGRKNPHGHPHEETLRILSGATIFRTDTDGAIGLKEDPDGGVEIKTCSEFRFKEAQTTGDEISNIKRLFSVW